MDWSSFQLHGEAPETAFEALTGILFDRWCRREHGAHVRNFYFIRGAGGDGGVEAMAELADQTKIGLQAKWFREPMAASHIVQIRKSLAKAAEVRTGLRHYIVALPRDLADAQKKTSATKKGATTERARWRKFEEEAAKNWPNIKLTLWGDTRIAELLAEMGRPGLVRFWFRHEAIELDRLRVLFSMAREGWLRARYEADRHCAGKIEDDIELRLNGCGMLKGHLPELDSLRMFMSQACGAVDQLERWPQFLAADGATDLLTSWKQWVDSAERELDCTTAALRHAAPFPLVHVEEAETVAAAVDPILHLLSELAPKDTTRDPFGPITSTLSGFASAWSHRYPSPAVLRGLGDVPYYIGKPGAGKTQALARTVERRLNEGAPAVLVRAKQLDPSGSWGQLLPSSVGRTGEDLFDTLEALEAAAALVSARRAHRAHTDGYTGPTRTLVAFDGLDESANSHKWAELLGELRALAATYPRVLFVASMRPHLVDWEAPAERFIVHESDAPIDEIRDIYLSELPGRDATKHLEWVLDSPLSVRLYAELYPTISDVLGWRELLLPRLIGRKLDILDLESREKLKKSWPRECRPIARLVERLAVLLTEGSGPVDTDALLDAAEFAISPRGALSRLDLGLLLEHAEERGVFTASRYASADPLGASVTNWEPAYDLIADYSVAAIAARNIKRGDQSAPQSIVARPGSQSLFAALVGPALAGLIREGLWRDDDKRIDLISLALESLQYSESPAPPDDRQWVYRLLEQSARHCRLVVRKLLVPAKSIPDAPFGPRYAHEWLVGHSVVHRDLLWSLPGSLAPFEGKAWSFAGEHPLRFHLTEGEAWDHGPLLLVWGLTNVDAKLRAHVRTELARWMNSAVEQVRSLIQEVIKSNDQQMLESFFVTLAVAAQRARSNRGWEEIARLVEETAQKNPWWLISISVRSSVETLLARVRGTGSDRDDIRSFSVPALEVHFDRDAYQRARDLPTPVIVDLEWYVVPQSIRAFFDARDFRNAAQATEDDVAVEDVSDAILTAASKGALPRISGAGKAEASNELERRRLVKQARLASRPFPKVGDEARESRTAQLERWLSQLNERELELLGQAINAASQRPTTKPRSLAQIAETNDSLSKLLTAYGLPDDESGLVTLAKAYVAGYAGDLGWNERDFWGRVEGSDERIGAVDRDIQKQYRPATHGSRSAVASFTEKYTWMAMNAFVGSLAQSHPAQVEGQLFSAPIPARMLAEQIPLKTPTDSGRQDSPVLFEVDALVPEARPPDGKQREMANWWIENAELPDLQPLLLPVATQLPEWARSEEWITLRAFVSDCDPNSQADQIVRTSAFCVGLDSAAAFSEDARATLLGEMHKVVAGVQGGRGYLDPEEVVWAPWIGDVEADASYTTVDRDCRPERIGVKALTTQFCWHDLEHEREEWMPVRWLREKLGAVRWEAGRLLDQDDAIVGWSFRDVGPAWRRGSRQYLLVDRKRLLKVLAARRLKIFWGTWVFREPGTHLFTDALFHSENRGAWARRSTDLVSTIEARNLVTLSSRERERP